MVSLLKAWKVTVVGIECDIAAFLHHFKKVWKVNMVRIECNGDVIQEGPHQKLFLQGFFQNSASKLDGKLYYSWYCQLSYVINGKLLATHF